MNPNSISSYANPILLQSNYQPTIVPSLESFTPSYNYNYNSSLPQSATPSSTQNGQQSNASANGNAPKKITLQVVKYNNNRGSFNTTINTPGTGFFPTINGLKVKLDDVAAKSNMQNYDYYYRYGLTKPKTLLTDDSFEDIVWTDERLVFNITENQTSGKRKQSSDDNPKPKKISKYDKNNEDKTNAEASLRQHLTEELRGKMSHADFIHGSCLMVQDPQRWTIQAMQEYFTKKYEAPNHKKKELDNNSFTQTIMDLQGTVLKLQQKVMNLEAVVNEMKRGDI